MIDALQIAITDAGPTLTHGIAHLAPVAADHAGPVLAEGVPQPTPEAPPGSEGFLRVLNWIFWGILVVSVAGFLIQVGMLIYHALQGSALRGFMGIIISVAAAILAGSATAILNMFI